MKAKLMRKEPPILTLDSIQTWDASGPELITKIPRNEYFQPNSQINSKVSLLFQGFNTNFVVDAIVCPANVHLMAGGGLNGGIFAAAGPELIKECQKIGRCDCGKAVLTNGYQLPCKYIIHAVGPCGDDKPQLLLDTYNSILSFIKNRNDIRSIALTSISTDVFGFPADKAADIALRAVRVFLEEPENFNKVDRIVFVLFKPEEIQIYLNLFPSYFPLMEQTFLNENSQYDNFI
ncbi:O-acetyl-ADP-ribose deacetylase macrod1 [Tritrichomonas musculus]|uniref:O-acetyl-ADP-ribose deacetylase macrod1 n=1 Tax=Tritrichomonas musculus TaxID=1915356 RepID=A0ABR2KLI2_9EUKA